ncbi:hypothetical protein [Catellatospora sp. NPDC049609]|uniref:hypothetical protein n=1 Tax=Catellatospora sp. NPDC049609 TaxID=3155505 RepID=UPI003418DF28
MATLPGHVDRGDTSRWLLVRRSISNPNDLVLYLCSGSGQSGRVAITATFR